MLRSIVCGCCLLLLPLYAGGWGFFAHQRINRLAVFHLPANLLRIYKPHLEYLVSHAVDADKRRYIVEAEGPRHYIDIDHYGASPYPTLPRSWQEALYCYGADTLQRYGILPWHITHMMARLTQAFCDRDLERVIKLSADLGHYIADAHVPLHACSNHNGQLSGQEGIHGLWETNIPELLADKTFSYWAGQATYIRDIQTSTWQIILESAAAADTVLKTERILSLQYPPGRRFAYEKRNGKLVRNYARAYTKAYHRALGNMVERRMQGAIHMTASYWFTAWANAGMPPLEKLDRKMKPEPLPRGNSMLGRQEG
jgi:hypothetical protein